MSARPRRSWPARDRDGAACGRRDDPETAVRFIQAISALDAGGPGSQAGVRSFEHGYDFMRGTATRR
jgi:hypothetical protein